MVACFGGSRLSELIVEELSEEVPTGLTRTAQLQNDVELRLRNAGIAILPSNQANQGAAPYLYVRVNCIQCRISDRTQLLSNPGFKPHQ
jgi:hypothetical protein